MNRLALLSFTALTMFVMADDVITIEESPMISDGCERCKPPEPTCKPKPPEPCKPKPPEPCKPPPPKPCKPPPPPCKPKPPVCKKPCPPVPVCCNILCSADPLSANGWFVFADALYWHADVDNSDWAFKNNDTTSTVIAGPNHALDFKWSWGFRAGIGANMDYDQWDTNLYYTWFRTSHSNSLGTEAAQVGSDLLGLASPFTQGSINWKVQFSMIDWELGRAFYVSKHLSLRPHIGIKGGWIHQRVRENFTKAIGPYSSSSKNNFWGVGASGGFNSAWTFATLGSNHFGFFGDFAGALMYGHFNVKHEETSFNPSGLSRNLMVPMLQGLFGLSWDTGFSCNQYHFGIRVGYEFQYWWKQNQMLRNEIKTGSLINYSRSSGDLGLQGLTVDFRFDF